MSRSKQDKVKRFQQSERAVSRAIEILDVSNDFKHYINHLYELIDYYLDKAQHVKLDDSNYALKKAYYQGRVESYQELTEQWETARKPSLEVKLNG